MMTALAAAMILTCVGLVTLWPNDERPKEIQQNALEMGLTAELLRATVQQKRVKQDVTTRLHQKWSCVET